MTPKQIIHKALRTKYGCLTISKVKVGDVSYSYHKITDKVACMVIHENDAFGYLSHMVFAREEDSICQILPMNMYVSHDKDITYKKLSTIKDMVRNGMNILQGI